MNASLLSRPRQPSSRRSRPALDMENAPGDRSHGSLPCGASHEGLTTGVYQSGPARI
ncbi:hypothetical protein ACFFX0_18145 [Citricoccus parietis]|uniref:Uncharacterized protein n=1 Tax=Citricoccus parietis TaxID=592307 RepID=A0ABV5G259_9MICC